MEGELAALLGEGVDELAVGVDDVDVCVLGLLGVDLEFEVDGFGLFGEGEAGDGGGDGDVEAVGEGEEGEEEGGFHG